MMNSDKNSESRQQAESEESKKTKYAHMRRRNPPAT